MVKKRRQKKKGRKQAYRRVEDREVVGKKK